MAGRGLTRWWAVVAFVAVAAAAAWGLAGTRVLLAHHRAAHGTPPGSTAASGARSGSRAGGVAVSLDKISPRLLGSDTVRAQVLAMAFTPDGKTLVTRLDTGVVQVRDAATGGVRFSAGPKGYAIDPSLSSLAISPDGKVIAIGVNNFKTVSSSVDLISVTSGKVTATIPVGAPEVHSLAFSPDGKTLAIGAGKSLLLTNLATRASISVSTSQVSFMGDSMYVSFSADDKSLVVASTQGLVKIWNVRATGFTTSMIPSDQGTGGPVLSAVAISPDGSLVAASGYLDASGQAQTWLWNPRTDRVRTLLPLSAQSLANNGIASQALSSDGTLLATGDEAGTIRLWNTATGRLVATEHAPSNIATLTAIAFNPDGTSLVTAQSTDSTAAQEGTATLQLWGLHPAAGQSNWQLPATGNGSTGQSSPAHATSPTLSAVHPGVYRVARVMGIEGSWVITLDSVQVTNNRTAIFTITVKNTSTSEGGLDCNIEYANPSGATITFSTGQLVNLVVAPYCPNHPVQNVISVPSQGSLKYSIFLARSQGLGRPFTLVWTADGFRGTLSGVTLSR